MKAGTLDMSGEKKIQIQAMGKQLDESGDTTDMAPTPPSGEK